MNKEIELTQKLKELGAKPKPRLNYPYSWTIESCLTWLREKGWAYDMEGWGQTIKVKVYKGEDEGVKSYTEFVNPGHELEGLLECMVKIEGKKK